MRLVKILLFLILLVLAPGFVLGALGVLAAPLAIVRTNPMAFLFAVFAGLAIFVVAVLNVLYGPKGRDQHGRLQGRRIERE
jgi:membrane protein implicated in regulation of membrane protease activity